MMVYIYILLGNAKISIVYIYIVLIVFISPSTLAATHSGTHALMKILDLATSNPQGPSILTKLGQFQVGMYMGLTHQ